MSRRRFTVLLAALLIAVASLAFVAGRVSGDRESAYTPGHSLANLMREQEWAEARQDSLLKQWDDEHFWLSRYFPTDFQRQRLAFQAKIGATDAQRACARKEIAAATRDPRAPKDSLLEMELFRCRQK